MTASVVLGARLLAAADDTVLVWALAQDRGSGAPVVSGDLTASRVRFASDADLGRYYLADEPIADGLVLVREVGSGELLARSAVGPAGAKHTLRVPIEVDPNRVPPDVTTGSVVDVWVSDSARTTTARPAAAAGDKSAGESAPGATGSAAGPALAEVTVLDAPDYADTFAVTGARQLVIAVEEEAAADFERQLASLQTPVIRVLQRS